MTAESRTVIFRVTAARLDEFDAACAAAGLSRSAALRCLMARAVDEFRGVVPLFAQDDLLRPGDNGEPLVRR